MLTVLTAAPRLSIRKDLGMHHSRLVAENSDTSRAQYVHVVVCCKVGQTTCRHARASTGARQARPGRQVFSAATTPSSGTRYGLDIQIRSLGQMDELLHHQAGQVRIDWRLPRGNHPQGSGLRHWQPAAGAMTRQADPR